MSKKKNNETRQGIDLSQQLKSVDIGIKDGVFIFTSPLSAEELSKKLNKNVSDIIKFFFLKGTAINLNTVLNEEQIGEICLEYNLDFKIEKEVNDENILENILFDDQEKDLKNRPAIVTIMGHVDHGKTTLLDAIRQSHVVDSESGGITQHIGAYQIKHNDNYITFIDTPGHEIFTEMRARGANITDIVILVVAADDGLKPQTQEAIDHAKAAGVELIVFVNKMDKQGANYEKVMSQLSEQNIVSEEWGGNHIFIKGSALQKEGINELLDSIQLLSEIKNYRANPNRFAYGTIVESNLDKGYGPLATIIVQNGTLKKSDYIVAGQTFGKVRMMFDSNGKELTEALPSTPVKIAGLNDVAIAGDKFLVLENEKQARELAEKIKNKNSRLEWNKENLALRQQIEEGIVKDLKIILKSDVHGSMEAIKSMIDKINIEKAHASIIRSAIGAITETDIRLAKASNAIIIGFNIYPNKIIKDISEQEKVKIYTYDIVYKLKEDVEKMMKGKLDPIIVEEVIGEAEVRKTWKHSDIGTICGCFVTSGKIKRGAKVRVIREGALIYNSEINSMQHGKNPVSEISMGNECGLTIKNFNDVKENDILEVYLNIEKTQE